MERRDRPRLLHALKVVCRTFRKEPPDRDLAEGWWAGLDDLPLKAVEYGVKWCLQNCKFMPVPAEVRRAAQSFQLRAKWEEEERLLREVAVRRALDAGLPRADAEAYAAHFDSDDEPTPAQRARWKGLPSDRRSIEVLVANRIAADGKTNSVDENGGHVERFVRDVSDALHLEDGE